VQNSPLPFIVNLSYSQFIVIFVVIPSSAEAHISILVERHVRETGCGKLVLFKVGNVEI